MGIYDPETDCVHTWDKVIGYCAGCGKEMLKKHMVTVSIKRHYRNPKTLCHMCEDCFSKFLDQYEVSE